LNAPKSTTWKTELSSLKEDVLFWISASLRLKTTKKLQKYKLRITDKEWQMKEMEQFGQTLSQVLPASE
jgi:hypothetical protein